MPPFNISQNHFELKLYYSSSSVIVNPLELIEPYQIRGSVNYNKYGNIFKNFIFPAENSHASISLTLYRLVESKSQSITMNTLEKLKFNRNTTVISTSQTKALEEVPIDEELSLNLIFYDDSGNLIESLQFYNEINIHNIFLEHKHFNTIESHDDRKTKALKNDRKQSVVSASRPYEVRCTINVNESSKWWKVFIYYFSLLEIKKRK